MFIPSMPSGFTKDTYYFLEWGDAVVRAKRVFTFALKTGVRLTFYQAVMCLER